MKFCVLDNAFAAGMKLCRTYPKGFAYFTFGLFVYHIYSADSFEVFLNLKSHRKYYKILNGFQTYFICIIFQSENRYKSEAHGKKFHL